MRIAIVGSRKYPDLERVAAYVGTLLSTDVVVSGGAAGVDQAAAGAARSCGLDVVEHLPDWQRLGKAAGMIRNKTIVNDADSVVAFWDGHSKGTQHTITLARRAGKLLMVCGPDGAPVVEALMEEGTWKIAKR